MDQCDFQLNAVMVNGLGLFQTKCNVHVSKVTETNTRAMCETVKS